MRKVTYHSQPAVPAAPAVRQAVASRVRSELGDKLQAALTIGSIVGVLILLIVGAVVLFAADPLRLGHLLIPVCAGLVAGFGTFSWFAIEWTHSVAARDWGIDDEERRRRYDQEDEEHDARLAALQGKPSAQTSRPVELDAVADVILRRYFRGLSVSRDECVDAGATSQGEWNAANAVFRALGWKQGKRFDPGDAFQDAWANWLDLTKFDEGHTWVIDRSRSRPGWKAID